MCDTCQLPIEGKSISALGKNYHPDHFVCGICQKPITESPFHQKDGKPLCYKDFAATCPQCAQCEQPITDKVITALGKQWHEDHFLCDMCKIALGAAEFHEREGKAVCQECFRCKVADKCKACGEPIEASATIALDAKWHPDCFKCTTCGKVILSAQFKVNQQGFPLCDAC